MTFKRKRNDIQQIPPKRIKYNTYICDIHDNDKNICDIYECNGNCKINKSIPLYIN